MFQTKCEESKAKYYEEIVSDLKTSNPGQWYSKLKRMSSYDQHKEDITIVEELVNLPVKDQAEKIADNFAKISNEYQPLNSEELDCLFHLPT